jgi:hypothetical protein
MSGPYTVAEAYAFFGGHFLTAPLGLVEKEPGKGKWCMIQNNSVLDTNGVSTNSWLDPKDIAIKWHTCSAMADMVRPFSSTIPSDKHYYFCRFGSLFLPIWPIISANLAYYFANLALY